MRAAVLILWLSACSAQQVADTAGRTLGNMGRAACSEAGNCDNVCPDGSYAAPPHHYCPPAK
ncbi:MAG: hypothetical protein ACPG06_05980 [Alphaproteobacteria bacterium]